MNSEQLELLDDTGEDDVDPIVLHPDVAERGLRLDRFLSVRFPDLSRTYLQRVVTGGGVLVDGVVRQQTFKITPGQAVSVLFPETETTELVSEPMHLDIVYEDADLLVLNKPAGLVVHPAPGHPAGTLVNGLLHYLPELSVGGTNRPGIVHRLDKDTSGLMVVAKSDAGHSSLTSQWSSRTVDKRYLVLVRGDVEVYEGSIDVPIGRSPGDRQRMSAQATGKSAVSHFTVLDRFQTATLVEVELVTGRTHQIRVHMAFIGHPVVGDEIYNRTSGQFGGTGAIVARQFLHASRLSFDLPSSGEQVTFKSALPADLIQALQKLGSESLAGDPNG